MSVVRGEINKHKESSTFCSALCRSRIQTVPWFTGFVDGGLVLSIKTCGCG